MAEKRPYQDIDIFPGYLQIRTERDEQPFTQFAIRLEVIADGEWTTIWLADNSHGATHVHRWVAGERQPAEDHQDVSPTKGYTWALRYAIQNCMGILEDWSESR